MAGYLTFRFLRLVTPLVVSVHPSAGLSIWTFFIPRGNSGSCAWKSAVLQTWKDTCLASPEMAMFRSEIPGIYFDYLRTGDPRRLQPIFFHNALDIISLAALTVELSEVMKSAREGKCTLHGLDLFSLSRIFERAGAFELSASICDQALSAGLPEALEPRALWHLARQCKRLGRFDAAVEIWLNLARRDSSYVIDAHRELIIHYERRQRDLRRALEFIEAALALLRPDSLTSPARRIAASQMERLMRRRSRLQRRLTTAKSESS